MFQQFQVEINGVFVCSFCYFIQKRLFCVSSEVGVRSLKSINCDVIVDFLVFCQIVVYCVCREMIWEYWMFGYVVFFYMEVNELIVFIQCSLVGKCVGGLVNIEVYIVFMGVYQFYWCLCLFGNQCSFNYVVIISLVVKIFIYVGKVNVDVFYGDVELGGQGVFYKFWCLCWVCQFCFVIVYVGKEVYWFYIVMGQVGC